MSGRTKAERLEEMKRLYIQRAYTDIDLAKKLGVSRETIFRDRKDLTLDYPVEPDEEGRWHIPRSKLISEIKLNLHEALTLYLAGRKASRQTRFHQPHTVNAVEKLAATLRQPMTERLLKSAEQVMGQEKNPEKIKIIETITQAWVEQRKARIEYQALGSDGLTRHTINPYIIEPSIWSDSVYVIAQSDFNDQIFAFKMDRILSATLSGETFEIPESFNDEELLKHAWGIWYGNREPEQVKLRFSPAVTRRVKESIWHPLERVEDTEDGGCIWSVDIAEWREMLPWVRGWGADCEVLEPKSLREALTREAQSLAELYRVVEMKNKFIAHFRKKDKKIQYLSDHLNEVSELAGDYASKIGLRESGELLGLLHDLGKASKEFQNYIKSANEKIDPDSDDYVDAKAKKGKVDHSSAGAQVIYKQLWDKGAEARLVAQVLSLAIASHHSGLINCLLPSGEDDFTRRMQKAEENTHVEEAFSNLEQQEKDKAINLLANDLLIKNLIEKFKSLKEGKEPSDTHIFKCGLLIRFLLSCLLDADRLNTATFEFPRGEHLRNNNKYIPWVNLIERLNVKINELEAKQERNEVDELRSRVSQSCLNFSTKPKGIYQLTVPTGGGKTFASLRFALHHAKEHSMDRVFYVIPYTSIIDQNAEEVRKIMEEKDGKGNYLNKVVLEHHSNLTPEEETHRQNLLSENWDAPIVFTTQVQFLEALFGSGTRSARRMHQLANSVIIFDEIQTIPIQCVHMFNIAIRFLVHTCGATVVLCTATQPLLDKVEPIQRALKIESGQKIISYEKELFQKLKRVEVFDKTRPEKWGDDEVAELADQQLREKGSVLIIVNTKPSARSVYQAVLQKSNATIYHLSTNMCAAHRLEVLEKVKTHLKNEEPVICVSTQLIEAGVDIDFGAVIRYLAGMDSIAQAAGRCNRHGSRKSPGNVLIVNPKQENTDRLKDIKIGIEKAETMLRSFKDTPEKFDNDLIGLNMMDIYYQYYFYERKGEMPYIVDKDSIVGQADNLFNLLSINNLAVDEYVRINKSTPEIPFTQSFQIASRAFHVIDDNTRGVIVPYGEEGRELISELCSASFDLEKRFDLVKKAQRYSVNMFIHHEFNEMVKNHAVHEVQEGAGIYYLDNEYYNKEFGWSKDSTSGMETLIK